MIYALLLVTLSKTTVIDAYPTFDKCFAEAKEYNISSLNRAEVFVCEPIKKTKK